jgi:hypothetical protein
MILRILSLVFLCGLASAQGDQNSGTNAVNVTVCKALSKALQYDGQMVRMGGRVAGTDEGGWFVGDKCPAVFITENDHLWPSVVSLATPSSTTVGRTRIHSVGFTFDSESDRRVRGKYLRIHANVPDQCISWSYTGLFETRRDWSTARMTYPNGTSKVIGFGHLGQAPAQIILKSADDVSVIPNCGSALSKPQPGQRPGP